MVRYSLKLHIDSHQYCFICIYLLSLFHSCTCQNIGMCLVCEHLPNSVCQPYSTVLQATPVYACLPTLPGMTQRWVCECEASGNVLTNHLYSRWQGRLSAVSESTQPGALLVSWSDTLTLQTRAMLIWISHMCLSLSPKCVATIKKTLSFWKRG